MHACNVLSCVIQINSYKKIESSLNDNNDWLLSVWTHICNIGHLIEASLKVLFSICDHLYEARRLINDNRLNAPGPTSTATLEKIQG